MPERDQIPLSRCDQNSADSACGHCDGVICHEPWCITQNTSVQYAYQVISDPSCLSPGDHLVLHALGVAWTEKESAFIPPAPITTVEAGDFSSPGEG
jgi:hypothetical protein